MRLPRWSFSLYGTHGVVGVSDGPTSKEPPRESPGFIGIVTERALSADGGGDEPGHESHHRLVDIVSDVNERLIRYDRPEQTATSLRAVYDVTVPTQSGVGADGQHF